MRDTICVVIPHGGNLELLDRQLCALSQQTLAPSRIVVSCNAPGSYDEFQAYLSENIHLTGVHSVDSSSTPGPSAARNAGWRTATQDLVLFCDDDDIVTREWVQNLSSSLKFSDVCAGALEYSELNTGRRAKDVNTAARTAPVKFCHLEYGPTANLGVRIEVLEALEGFNEEVLCAEDIDFCWRAQYEGFSFSYSAKAVIHYQLRDDMWRSFKRGYDYGSYDGWLLNEHYPFGARRTLREGARQLAAIPYALLQAIVRRNDGNDFAQKLGALLGRCVSSVKYKTWVV